MVSLQELLCYAAASTRIPEFRMVSAVQVVLSETLNFHHQFRLEIIRPGAVDFCTAVSQGTSNGIVHDTRVTANDHLPTQTARIELVGVIGKQHWIFLLD